MGTRRGLSALAAIVVLAQIVFGEALYSNKVRYDDHQPLSKVMLHNSRVLWDSSVSISASPTLLGQKVTPFPHLHSSTRSFSLLPDSLFVSVKHWNHRCLISHILFDDHGRVSRRIT